MARTACNPNERKPGGGFYLSFSGPAIPPGAPSNKARRAAKTRDAEGQDCHAAMLSRTGSTHPKMMNLIYEYSRIA
jgi:hypothetical protein